MKPVDEIFGDDLEPLHAALNARLSWLDKVIANTLPSRSASYYVSKIRGFNVYLSSQPEQRHVESDVLPEGVTDIVVMRPYKFELVKEFWLAEDEVIYEDTIDFKNKRQ